MRVRFWGVRGSIPVPGAETSRYGGNSSCVEISLDGGPALVLDCGTGARPLGRELLQRGVREVHVLFSHFHMDHVFGFPFFGPIYAPSCAVDVVAPAYSSLDAEAKLARYLNGIYHPVRLSDVPARMRFRGIRPGREISVGPFQVTGLSLNHPGGACGYRIVHGRRSVVYLTDTAPLARPGEGLLGGRRPPSLERRVLEAIQEADLVIMDTMFTADEYLEKMTWGHGYPEYAVALAEAAGSRRLALFHHSPDADDAELDVLAARWADHPGVEVRVAAEGGGLDLPD